MIVGRIEGGYFDEAAREIYVTDSYLRGRVLVFNMDTMAFKRGWGAYGKPLKDIPVGGPAPKYDPKAPPAKDFIGHLTVAVSRDGFVYAADRQADRIQVYQKDGKFVREFTVAPETLDRGSTGGMAFSPDQRFIYVSDIMNNVIWIVNRADGRTLGHFSFFGHTRRRTALGAHGGDRFQAATSTPAKSTPVSACSASWSRISGTSGVSV